MNERRTVDTWHIFVCPGCGRNVHGPRHLCNVPNPGLSERVEVVRARQLAGAVGALVKIAAKGPAVDMRGAALNELKRLGIDPDTYRGQ